MEVQRRRHPLGEGSDTGTERRARSERSRARRARPPRPTPGRCETSPVTSGRSGLFLRSISRSAIWLTMLEAAFIADAHRDPMAIVSTTAQVTRRAGSGLCADPKAQTAPETMPRSGGSSVNGRARRR